MSKGAGLIILIVLGTMGLLPVGFTLWFASAARTLHWLHAALLMPGIFALLAMRRFSIRSNRLSSFWIWAALLLGSAAAVCALISWAHLFLSACLHVLWIRSRALHLPGWTFPAAFFILIQQGYILLSIPRDTLSALGSTIDVFRRPAKNRYGLPIVLEPDENKIVTDTLGIQPISIAHDARVQVNKRKTDIGIALLLFGGPKSLNTLLRLAQLRFQFGDTRAVRDFSRVWSELYQRLGLRELWFTPFTPWFWGIWVGKYVSERVAGFAAEKALSQALVEARKEDETALDAALGLQISAGAWLLKRIWTAIDQSKSALSRLKKEKPTKNLFRIDPDARYEAMEVDSGELSRVCLLSPEICAKISPMALNVDARESRGQLDQVLEKYEQMFTRRILYESVFEYRLHAMALGADVEPETLKRDE